METGLTRTVATPPPVAPTRTPEPPAAVKTELPAPSAVQQSNDASGLAERDARQESYAQRAGFDNSGGNRREIENDAATGIYVMKVVEESSGDVVDQVPADAYLRMKVALKTLLESGGRESTMAPLSA